MAVKYEPVAAQPGCIGPGVRFMDICFQGFIETRYPFGSHLNLRCASTRASGRGEDPATRCALPSRVAQAPILV